MYVLRRGDEAVLIDYGDGSVWPDLAEIGVTRVTDVLMTHHHRDQAQGLRQIIEMGARVWVPHMEQDLFSDVDVHWQARAVYNNYNVRQDRFSLLASVPVYDTLKDYQTMTIGGFEFQVVPTPGHTIGSISLLTTVDGIRCAFTGDLIYGPGKVWSLAATQWTYNGAQGVPASILSLRDLKSRSVARLLPSHGEVMDRPGEAIDLLVDRLHQLLQSRNQYKGLMNQLEAPFKVVTPHLLFNRTSVSNSYVVLSDSGKALIIDYGYDFTTGLGAGEDRASRRPWLYTIPILKQQFNVSAINVVIATHYHDDHVAGLNLLQSVEQAQVWAGENFADVLEHPSEYDLPCLWYDPIRVDRRLPLNQPIQWEEYTFIVHEQPGHTLYADAIEFVVDGKTVLAIGDQQDNEGDLWNYVYQNRFRPTDYIDSANLYTRIQPDIILSGHWDPLWIEPGYIDELARRGELLYQLHRDLLPLDEVNLGAEGFAARLRPYQSTVRPGETFTVNVEVVNPHATRQPVKVAVVAPANWTVEPVERTLQIEGHSAGHMTFRVTTAIDAVGRRHRIAADVTAGELRLGQQAEALVTIG